MAEQELRAEPGAALAARLADFARQLQGEGFRVDPGSLLDAQQALAAGLLDSRVRMRAACRCCFCRTPEQWRRFEAVFDAYWQRPWDSDAWGESDANDSQEHADSGARVNRLIGFSGASDKDDVNRSITGAGDFKTLSLADFRFVFDPAEMRRVESIVDTLARRIRRRQLRRTRVSHRGTRLHVQRTLRASLAHNGQVVQPWFHQRRRELPSVVLLLDISQSMEVYSKLFLRFARQVLSVFDRSSAFAFNTEVFALPKATRRLDERDIEAAMNANLRGWLGGTRIAQSLEQVQQRYPEQFSARTTVVVFSDGCDTARASVLADTVAGLSRRVGRTLWVNPLLGRFEPGEADPRMDPVRPWLDFYGSGHNVASLERFADALLHRNGA